MKNATILRRGPTGLLEELRRRRVKEEREKQAVRLGEIQSALQGSLGVACVAERVARERLQQEGVDGPERRIRHGWWKEEMLEGFSAPRSPLGELVRAWSAVC